MQPTRDSMRPRTTLFAAALLAFGCCLMVIQSGCKRPVETTLYSATGIAEIQAADSFTEGRLAAVQEAEKNARDQILVYVKDMKFPNGVMLDEALVTDPFIQAKIYDTIRTAKISDQTVSPDGIVTVTIQMDLDPIFQILNSSDYGGTDAAAPAK